MSNITRRNALAGLATVTAAGPARAADHQKLDVIVFQGLQNLPLFAAQTTGCFGRRGLEVELKITPNSDEMRGGLAEGRYQIAHGAVDNAIAMAEVAKADIAVVIGGDNGFNQLIVQAGIGGYADLRGKTVIVDAPNTAYALQLYEMLEQNGLKKGDYTVKPVGATFKRLEALQEDKSYAASMLNPPFSLRAEDAGLKSLGSAVKAIGPYQASTGFVMRAWAKQNEDVLVRYLQGYVEGLRWALDPANKEYAIDFLVKRLFLTKGLAERSYAIAADPAEGLAKDAAVDLAGFNNVLKLRAKHLNGWGGNPPSPDKYTKLSYYRKAIAGL